MPSQKDPKLIFHMNNADTSTQNADTPTQNADTPTQMAVHNIPQTYGSDMSLAQTALWYMHDPYNLVLILWLTTIILHVYMTPSATVVSSTVMYIPSSS
jgi:hypothetical protein